MAVTIKPAAIDGTALVANQVSLTASYLEQYRKPRCCNALVPVQVSVTYSYGQTVLNGSTVFVPIIATITAVYVMKDGSTRVKTFVEIFDIAFQGQLDSPTSVTISSLGKNVVTSTSCNGTTSLSIDDSLTVLIA